MTKVYGIYIGNQFEGGYTQSTIYRDKKEAIDRIKDVVKDKNDYLKELNENWQEEFKLFKKVKNGYKNDVDEINLVEYELQ